MLYFNLAQIPPRGLRSVTFVPPHLRLWQVVLEQHYTTDMCSVFFFLLFGPTSSLLPTHLQVTDHGEEGEALVHVQGIAFVRGCALEGSEHFALDSNHVQRLCELEQLLGADALVLVLVAHGKGLIELDELLGSESFVNKVKDFSHCSRNEDSS